jgi:NAD(P)-dependent dehydrogenase (short-subunit alcohol dehydrogenase family)
MLTSSSAEMVDWSRDWIAGRTIIVIGGTGGIGAGVAECFRDAGASVYATAATEAECADARSTDTAGSIDYTVLDVRNSADVKAFMSTFDSIDVVLNCAGIIKRGQELDPEVFSTVLDINLNGTMRVCAAAVDALQKTGGTIINIASMMSFFGSGPAPGYASSKGGVAQLTKSLAISFASKGVRVNAIAPGWIATPLTKELQDDDAKTAPILSRTPMNRWGTPDDLRGIVLFLASPHAAFITGAIIPVDGGYSIC